MEYSFSNENVFEKTFYIFLDLKEVNFKKSKYIQREKTKHAH